MRVTCSSHYHPNGSNQHTIVLVESFAPSSSITIIIAVIIAIISIINSIIHCAPSAHYSLTLGDGGAAAAGSIRVHACTTQRTRKPVHDSAASLAAPGFRIAC